MVIKTSFSAGKAASLLWMLPIQLLLLAAWLFNLLALGAIMADSWKAEQLGKVFGIGVLFLWLLCAGWIILRTTIRRPSLAEA